MNGGVCMSLTWETHFLAWVHPQRVRSRNFWSHLLLTPKMKEEDNFLGFFYPLLHFSALRDLVLILNSKKPKEVPPSSALYSTGQMRVLFSRHNSKMFSQWLLPHLTLFKSLEETLKSVWMYTVLYTVVTSDFNEEPHDFKLNFKFRFISKEQNILKLQFKKLFPFFHFQS